MDKNQMIGSVNRFGFELFKVFTSRHKTEYKNLCFGPLTVFNSLAMILVGAQGQSRTQLAETLYLHKPEMDRPLLEALKQLTDFAIKGNHDIIQAMRFLYINEDIELNSEYKALLRDYFEVKAKKVDFSFVQITVDAINSDAKDSTDGVIDDLIKRADISGQNINVKLILTNSLFFRGFWEFGFEEVLTQEFRFGYKNKDRTQIQMMRNFGYYRYLFSQHLRAHIVSIAYAASDLRMIVLLPADPSSDSLYLIESLNKWLFEAIVAALQWQKTKTLVELTIPRFALDARQMSVQKTVQQMGAVDVFNESLADLKTMSTESSVHLTKLVHKSFILVDERGSALGDPRVRQRLFQKKANDSTKPVIFRADRPFVFIIAGKVTKLAAFMAYFGDPREMLEVVKESDLSPEQIYELLSSNQ